MRAPYAKSYDEIVRRTVLQPDGSWAPSPAQERKAFERGCPMSDDEQDLCDRVHDILLVDGVDMTFIQMRVDGGRVILRGRIDKHHAPASIVDRISRVDGVIAVIDLRTIA